LLWPMVGDSGRKDNVAGRKIAQDATKVKRAVIHA
jgi:hypothetical protein